MDKKLISIKVKQGIETRKKLIKVATDIFSNEGFEKASMEEIVIIARVTRGALYHHFENKLALFESVFDNVQAQISDHILTAANKEPDKWDQLVAGCKAFLEACIDPKIQRIAIIDAPSVLGLNTWRKVDSSHGQFLLTSCLNELIKDGIIRKQPVDALAHILSGAINEAALWIAQSKNPKKSLKEAMEVIETLLNSLIYKK